MEVIEKEYKREGERYSRPENPFISIFMTRVKRWNLGIRIGPSIL